MAIKPIASLIPLLTSIKVYKRRNKEKKKESIKKEIKKKERKTRSKGREKGKELREAGEGSKGSKRGRLLNVT